jgi:acetoin utilization deacetylase AcuC-like enzyme
MTTAYALELAPSHRYAGHPESPARLDLLRKLLPSLGASALQFDAASRADVGLVHSPALIQWVEEACRNGDAIIDPAPTFVARTSFDDALRAAGATMTCVRSVLHGESRNAFSVVRPPGHHAEPDRSMGFCIFNNVAIAARHALEAGLLRVAIVDFDAHHGNGTQAAFLHDERVLYLSTHQWGIYPGTGWYEEAPHARRRIVNVPLPDGAGDGAYARIAAEIIEPAVRAFEPQLILVSAGFDAHWKDPLTSLGLSIAGFYELARALVGLAEDQSGGRIVFVLEGGYDPAVVAGCATAVFAALTGDPFDAPSDAPPVREPDVSSRLAAIRAFHHL